MSLLADIVGIFCMYESENREESLSNDHEFYK